MRDGMDVTALTGPLSNDAIAGTENWEEASQQVDAQRRMDCPWDASV